MDRRDVLKRMLYQKCKTAIEFKFDTLMVNPLLTYITVQDIAQLNKIATSIKYSSKPKEKYAMIDSILTQRGFKKMASGTNRVAYRHLDDYRVVLKVAIDKVGLSDNGNEYMNQQLLKPFVTKCFEVSPCGTVGLFERVVPITSKEEFINISEDVFDLINNLIGKYVLEDIGEKYYMNYGLREGFGPVLLDYPYVFELDGRKLICNVQDPLEPKGYCGGEIDYDLGYNNLICKKCGKRYLATELKSEKKSGNGPKIIIEGDDLIMKCVLKRGDQVVSTLNSQEPISTNVISPRNQYDRMRGGIRKPENNFSSNQNNSYKQNIRKSDDIKLQARIKGQRKSKDVDKIAREKEARGLQNTPKVPVSFDKSNNVNKEYSKKKDGEFAGKIHNDKYNQNPIKKEKSINGLKQVIYEAFINNEGCIFIDNGSGEFTLLGFTKDSKRINYLEKRSKKLSYYEENESKEPVFEPDENIKKEDTIETVISEVVNTTESNEDSVEYSSYSSESNTFGTKIGDLMDKVFNGNDNYKTAGVVSPIDNHFHNSSIVESSSKEDSNNENNNKELSSDSGIPDVIIHPRNTEEDDLNMSENSLDDTDDDDILSNY